MWSSRDASRPSAPPRHAPREPGVKPQGPRSHGVPARAGSTPSRSRRRTVAGSSKAAEPPAPDRRLAHEIDNRYENRYGKTPREAFLRCGESTNRPGPACGVDSMTNTAVPSTTSLQRLPNKVGSGLVLGGDCPSYAALGTTDRVHANARRSVPVRKWRASQEHSWGFILGRDHFDGSFITLAHSPK